MALAATLAINNPNKKVWTVTGLDADTALSITHGMNGTPQVTITPRTTAIALAAAFGATASSSAITVQKQNAANSGGATPGTSIVCDVVAELNPQG